MIAQSMCFAFGKKTPSTGNDFYKWVQRKTLNPADFTDWKSLNYTEGFTDEHGGTFIAMLALHFTHLTTGAPKVAIENQVPGDGGRTATDLNHLLHFGRYAMFKVVVDGQDSKILKRRWQRLTILAPQ